MYVCCCICKRGRESRDKSAGRDSLIYCDRLNSSQLPFRILDEVGRKTIPDRQFFEIPGRGMAVCSKFGASGRLDPVKAEISRPWLVGAKRSLLVGFRRKIS